MSLMEIPYTECLQYTQMLLEYSSKYLATPHGFSYTGSEDMIVPCYNAMLLEAYIRLGKEDSFEAQNTLQWIKNDQIFDRNQKTSWNKDGICKHGGCMKSTPCYIGIGKTVRTLLCYKEMKGYLDDELENCLRQGIQYMLKHQMFKHLSNGKPNLKTNPQAASLLGLLKEKEVAPMQWKIDYIYKYKGYVAFDTRRSPSPWLSQLYSLWLK